MPGPPPKRDAERRRRNKHEVETMTVDLSQSVALDVEIPSPPLKIDKDTGEPVVDEETGETVSSWHPIALHQYMALVKSGQAMFYEPSDWAMAYALCETLSRELQPQPMKVQVLSDEGEVYEEVQWVKVPVKGATLNAFLKGMASLMATEGDRRRLRIELDREKLRQAGDQPGTNVVPISQHRQDRFRAARQHP